MIMTTARDIQAQIDPWFLRVGLRAPEPVAGQSPNHYLAEMCRFLKREFLPPVHPLYKVNYRKIRDDSTILNGFVPQLLEAVVVEAYNPNNVEPGEFRKIERKDEYGAVKFVEFIGPEHFTKAMGRPGRRVVSTCCPVDPTGRPCASLTIMRPRR
jgi:hypothetical protein